MLFQAVVIFFPISIFFKISSERLKVHDETDFCKTFNPIYYFVLFLEISKSKCERPNFQALRYCFFKKYLPTLAIIFLPDFLGTKIDCQTL